MLVLAANCILFDNINCTTLAVWHTLIYCLICPHNYPPELYLCKNLFPYYKMLDAHCIYSSSSHIVFFDLQHCHFFTCYYFHFLTIALVNFTSPITLLLSLNHYQSILWTRLFVIDLLHEVSGYVHNLNSPSLYLHYSISR